MCLMLLDSGWKQWYRLSHRDAYINLSGEAFEQYVSTVLGLAYMDFVDPDPMGRAGDGGCDGLANGGKTFFACYGQRASIDQDKKTRNKIKSDFEHALKNWSDFTEWRFVTNALVGPKATELITKLQQEHDQLSDRPLTITVIKTEAQFWNEYVSQLDSNKLDTMFPGCPHAQNIQLADLIELIDDLGVPDPDACTTEQDVAIKPVSVHKMDYNHIPDTTRIEFNEGRMLFPGIDTWFSEQANPELRDEKASMFHAIYEKAREDTDDPAEIMERIYIAVGGSDYRLDRKRANAVYAITSYFFDSCDIFEEVPEGDSR